MSINFGKLKLKPNKDTNSIIYNEQEIKVLNYLPIQSKLELIADAINLSSDGNNFLNVVKFNMFFELNIIFNYTNIIFTENQKSDLVKLYDLLKSNGIIDLVVNTIPINEYDNLYKNAVETANAIYKYQNSVLGILDTISADYSNLNFETTEMQKAISDPNNLKFLKDILTKLG